MMSIRARVISFVPVAARSYASRAIPHGGKLVENFIADPKHQQDLIKSTEGRSIELSERQSCDVELLANGAFSPLTGFMNEDVYKNVVDNMRLPGSNLLFGLPVTLDTNREDLAPKQNIALTYKNDVLAVLEIESKYKPDKPKEALKCYGTSALEHPGVQVLSMEKGRYYLGGKIHGFKYPKRVFPCVTPRELRESLPSNADIVAFQCRNPVHRAHYELFTRALDAPNVSKNSVVLVHPTCGPTQDDDIPGVIRYRTYEVLKAEVNNPRIQWAYLPYSMILAGPREAIQHMMIRKNYGCTHFIIGRDMAGSKSTVTSVDFYGAYDAQDFAKKHSVELGIDTVPSLDLIYCKEEGYVTAEHAKQKGLKPLKLSGTEFRRKLRAGEDIPEWFAFKSVVSVLRESINQAK